MTTTQIAFAIALASCTHAPPIEHVEILPLPSVSAPIANEPEDEDPQCKPDAIAAVGVDASGALDVGELRRVLASSMDFATRCCNGDEEKDAKVLVTVSPEGYMTEVKVTPESSGPTNACLYATFHRVITKSFRGDPLTVTVPIHVRSE